MAEKYIPGKALRTLFSAIAHPDQPIATPRDLIVGGAEGTVLGYVIASLPGCGLVDDLTPEMPPCTGEQVVTSCRFAPDIINAEVDKENPTLRSDLSKFAQPYADVIGVDSIEVYFHTFDKKMDQPRQFNAQPDIYGGIVSIHIWVEDTKSIPPLDDLKIAVKHEGAHALDATLAKNTPKGPLGIQRSTISPDISDDVYKIDDSGKQMKSGVIYILKEGEYIDQNTCAPEWCSVEREHSGHPQDNLYEAFADTFAVMLLFSSEFLKRISKLAILDRPAAEAIIAYAKGILENIKKYGDKPGLDALSVLGFDPDLHTKLSVLL